MKPLCADCKHWDVEAKTCFHPKAHPPDKITFVGVWGVCHCLDKKYFEPIESEITNVAI